MKEITSESRSTSSAPAVFLSALSERFASRGLAKSVLLDAEAQIAAEEKTRELAPDSYRLSLFSEETVRAVYRKGKDVMSGEDLLRYVEECKELRRRGKDFADCPSIYETASAEALEPTLPKPRAGDALRAIPKKISALPAATLNTVKKRFPLWIDFRAADTSKETRKFPLSAFAAIAAIAVSMMLIVASALMVTGAETEISRLNSEISTLNTEVRDLESKLESNTDLMELRRIAVEEYGMVEEDYVKMEYLSLDSKEAIEVFERDRNRELGLSAILSAIGWKK